MDTMLVKDPPFYMHGGSSGPSHDLAMKAGANELKGLEFHSSTHVEGLMYPLMTVVDYKGFRLIAMATLPISSESLLYGSSDSGRTLHKNDKLLNQLMKRAGTQCNLERHRSGMGQLRVVYGPGDMEAHSSTQNGRYYVLDFGRVLPPEDPRIGADGSEINSRQIFSQLLRQEFVKSYRVPLCSDAFSGWNSDPLTRQQSNETVTEATRYLYETVIPDAAKRYDESEVKEVVENLIIKEEIDEFLFPFSNGHLHEQGINLRHLGHIRYHSTNPHVRKMLLSICVARLLKDRLHSHFRFLVSTIQSSSDEPFRQAVVEQFNLILGVHTSSRLFWTDDVKRELELKYRKCLSMKEKDLKVDLRNSVYMAVLLRYAVHLMGITLRKKAERQMAKGREDFQLLELDIKGFKARTRFLGMFHVADALRLFGNAQKLTTSREKHRQLKVVDHYFSLAHDCAPTCPVIMFNWGRAISELALVAPQKDRECIFKRADSYFTKSYQVKGYLVQNGSLNRDWLAMIRNWRTWLQEDQADPNRIQDLLQKENKIAQQLITDTVPRNQIEGHNQCNIPGLSLIHI
eukprot:TRINITY_DN5372_c0_g1_i1.p1 TRINITY_DN5372_c0_g1~~TRINITY_DN5372_c0_g1_i1.p1  ORF type:complete len:670 (-),score=103.73 TRINITY_DN5372_c0_g1_i1:43-1761(-)